MRVGVNEFEDKRPQVRNAETRKTAADRRRSFVFIGSAVVVLGLVVALVVASMSPGGNKHRRSEQDGSAAIQETHVANAVELSAKTSSMPTSKSAERAVAEAENEFSLRLFRELTGGSANQLVSPFSLYQALAMTLLGARGQTASQMTASMNLSSVTVKELQAGLSTLDADLANAGRADHIDLRDANSIWTGKGWPINKTYLENIKSTFDAGVWQANFANDPAAADAAINAWVSAITDGRITSLVDPSDTPPDTAAVLLNAVLFEAKWAVQLTQTSQGTFESPNGAVPVTYLSPATGDTGFQTSTKDGATTVELPYSNGTPGQTPGRYAALLIMPSNGSLSKFIDQLDESELDDILASLSRTNIDLSVPQVKMSTNLHLQSTLENLGMTDAFGDAANFSGMSPIATKIADVVQRATLSITKWGTIASAATAVVMVPTAAMAHQDDITFNRPFLFLVRDTTTGTILFESAVNNPGN